MNRLMILGSLDEFVELVNCAKRRGYYTVVCDGYPNGPAKKFADKAYTIDIREVDAIVEVCKQEKINGIIASFSDILFEYLTLIANKAGIKTYCTPEKMVYLRSKAKMKEMFRSLDIPVPASKVIRRDSLQKDMAELDFPLLIKPVDGYGSRGIYIVESPEEIIEKFDEIAGYSNYPDQILAEEYNQGYEFNMANWIIDGEVCTLGLADREKTAENPKELPHISRVVYPSKLASKVYEEARSIVKKVADYTGIQTGPICMQFFWSEKSGIQVCECAGRLFGYEHELWTMGSGLSVEELLLDYVYDEAHMRKSLENYTPFYKKIVAGLYFHGDKGVIQDMSAVKRIANSPEVEDALIFYKEGDVIGTKPYVARFYISSDSYEKIDEITEKINNEMVIPDESGRNLVYHNEITRYPM